MTLIIGAKGSMGRRYQAILKYLEKPFTCADVDDDWFLKSRLCDSIILATPTDTHYNFLKNLIHFKQPILCEKPITKDLRELDLIKHEYRDLPLQMVMQYKELDAGDEGPSFYDYYNHGKDGLYWDALQIIGLARGGVEILEESPIWRCQLNGEQLSLNHMDYAYISMIRNWFKNPYGDLIEIKAIHQKVYDYAK